MMSLLCGPVLSKLPAQELAGVPLVRGTNDAGGGGVSKEWNGGRGQPGAKHAPNE